MLHVFGTTRSDVQFKNIHLARLYKIRRFFPKQTLNKWPKSQTEIQKLTFLQIKKIIYIILLTCKSILLRFEATDSLSSRRLEYSPNRRQSSNLPCFSVVSFLPFFQCFSKQEWERKQALYNKKTPRSRGLIQSGTFGQHGLVRHVGTQEAQI